LVLGPNPTSDEFTINTFPSNVEYELNLFDVNGSLTERSIVTGEKRIDTSQLEHGVYFFGLLNKEMKKTNFGKIMVYHKRVKQVNYL